MAPVSGVSDRAGRARREGSLALDDCLCPVCLEIFLEPVTLPCTHTFCKGCFLESVDKATQCCPMCRKRVSTWTRLNSRSKTLVNQQLWAQIQSSFPQQCQRRLSGQDAAAEDELTVSVCFPRVSQPGEVRREYQDQISKLTEEKRVLDEAESRASEEYIQRLLAEEEELLQEERQRREEDERLARMLSQQLNSGPAPQDSPRPADVTPAKKKVVGGQIEKFLCPLPSKASASACSSASSLVSNKENILLCRRRAEHSPPELDFYGAQALGRDDRDGGTGQSEPPTLHTASSSSTSSSSSSSTTSSSSSSSSSSSDDRLQPRRHPVEGGATAAKRKSWQLEEEEVVTVTKRGCPSLPSSSSSSPAAPEAGASAWRIQQEAELLRRQRQEEEDRQVALLLQKELNKEERQRVTDRSKGSADAYLLRRQRRGRSAGGAGTPGRASEATATSSRTASASSVRPSRTSSSSSSLSSSSGTKQTTLTEMFSSARS